MKKSVAIHISSASVGAFHQSANSSTDRALGPTLCRAICIFVVSAILTTHQAAQAMRSSDGTSSGSGNGVGVACFQNAAGANASVKDGRITQPASRFTLRLFDLWNGETELQPFVQPFVLPDANVDASTYLQQVLQQDLEPYLPYVGQLIRSAMQRIRTDRPINADGGLSLITPTGPIKRAFPSNCRKVALAKRVSGGTNGQETTGYLFIDSRLFARLPTLDKVGLLLHEAIYLMDGDDLGNITSELTEKFVRFLLTRRPHFQLTINGVPFGSATNGDDLLMTSSMAALGLTPFLEIGLPPYVRGNAPSNAGRQRAFVDIALNRVPTGDVDEWAFMNKASIYTGAVNADETIHAPVVQELFMKDPIGTRKTLEMCAFMRNEDRSRANSIFGVMNENSSFAQMWKRALGYCRKLR